MLFFMISCDNATGPKSNQTNNNFDAILDKIDDLPSEEVSLEEASGLAFMREEEKLAHDVYIVLYSKWGQRVFNNIASSESQHMNAIKKLLDKYELADPVGSNNVGVFVDTLLQNLYNNLTSYGDSSLVHALTVGAIIEEIDIRDIQNEIDSTVDNEDIGYVYDNLIRGSRNHLRAYVKKPK